jgi:hypothetical protein
MLNVYQLSKRSSARLNVDFQAFLNLSTVFDAAGKPSCVGDNHRHLTKFSHGVQLGSAFVEIVFISSAR